MKGKLIVFSAPSGSGKTTMVRSLLSNKNLKLKFSVSATSRPKRENEKNGHDYYFLSKEEFKKKIEQDEFIEWEEVYKDQYYGTLKSEIERIREDHFNVVFDIDVAGGISIKKLFKDQCLTIFIVPPSISELEKRLRKRGSESEESLIKRITKAEEEMLFSKHFDITVVNNNIQTAINESTKLIENFLNE